MGSYVDDYSSIRRLRTSTEEPPLVYYLHTMRRKSGGDNAPVLAIAADVPENKGRSVIDGIREIEADVRELCAGTEFILFEAMAGGLHFSQVLLEGERTRFTTTMLNALADAVRSWLQEGNPEYTRCPICGCPMAVYSSSHLLCMACGHTLHRARQMACDRIKSSQHR
jgi:hypothetical protein